VRALAARIAEPEAIARRRFAPGPTLGTGPPAALAGLTLNCKAK
jgi:hypothetical protein